MGLPSPRSPRMFDVSRRLGVIGRGIRRVLWIEPAPRLGDMSEIDRPAGSAPVAKHGSGSSPTRDFIDSHEELYKVAYQEAQRALDDQLSEINTVRDRSVQFTLFVGATTGFLVGAGLQSAHRDMAFYTLASIATALSAAFIGLLMAVLGPSTSKLWHYRVSARSLISGWIETEIPLPNDASFFRRLAQQYDDWHVENEKFIRNIRRGYRWLIIVGAVQLSLWVVLVWAKG
jgi:hypothetical protein